MLPTPRLGRAAAALLLFVACQAGCSSRPPPAAPFSAGLEAGARVEVTKGDRTALGTVVRPEGTTHVRVHYDGYGPEWDETLPISAVRPHEEAPPAREYRQGELLLVDVRGRLFLASVVEQLAPTVWRVRYDGFGPNAVEDVTLTRLRRPHAGTSSRGIGEPVQVMTGGGVRSGKIIAIVAEDRWLVRYDGLDANSDEEVPASRIYGASTTPQTVAPVMVPAPVYPAPAPGYAPSR